MTVLNGHFDGSRLVVDDPIPSDLLPQTRVRIVVVDAADSQSGANPFDAIAELAVDDDGLPADYPEQHDHYRRGTPKK